MAHRPNNNIGIGVVILRHDRSLQSVPSCEWQQVHAQSRLARLIEVDWVTESTPHVALWDNLRHLNRVTQTWPISRQVYLLFSFHFNVFNLQKYYFHFRSYQRFIPDSLYREIMCSFTTNRLFSCSCFDIVIETGWNWLISEISWKFFIFFNKCVQCTCLWAL